MNKIIKDMNITEYHSNKMILSATSLKYIKKSTRAFIHWAITPQESKPHFDFGNAFELYLIDAINGSNDFDQKVAVRNTTEWKAKVIEEKPDIKNPTTTKVYKDVKLNFENDNSGKYIIDDVGETESLQALQEMVRGCLSDPVVRGMLKNSDYQESFFWTDPETNVKMKTRPDLSKKKKQIIFDIKTCLDASPQAFARQAANLDYYLQAVCQIEGAIHTGYFEKCEGYFWLAVEKKPPYDWCIYEMQPQDIEAIYAAYKYLLKRGSTAIEHLRSYLNDQDHFVPSYGENADNPHGIVTAEMPLWYRYSF
jgi:hypothetical protein